MSDGIMRLRRKTIGHDPTRGFCNHSFYIGIIDIGNEHSIVRHESDQLSKSFQNMMKASVDVSMIKFNRRQDAPKRTIMKKFWSFIEIGGVVFISFNNKIFSGTARSASSEIFSNAANKKSRIFLRCR